MIIITRLTLILILLLITTRLEEKLEPRLCVPERFGAQCDSTLYSVRYGATRVLLLRLFPRVRLRSPHFSHHYPHLQSVLLSRTTIQSHTTHVERILIHNAAVDVDCRVHRE